MDYRKRQAMVPDFLFLHWMMLAELKSIHLGKSKYTHPASRKMCGAVEERAAKIPHEYTRKARKADFTFNDCPLDGPPGPVLRKLQEYGTVRGLIFGAFGETMTTLTRSSLSSRTLGRSARGVRWGLARSRRRGHATRPTSGVGLGYASRARTRASKIARSGTSWAAAEKRRANSKTRADRLHAEYARQASVGRQSWARS